MNKTDAIARQYGNDFEAVITFKGVVGERCYHIKWHNEHFLITACNTFIAVDDISTIKVKEK